VYDASGRIVRRRSCDEQPQKITFDDMRASCVRDVLIYCRDHPFSHHIEISAERWGDDVRLPDVEPGFTACGKRDADLRPSLRSRHGVQ
jgi:hypothetical protein